MPDLRFKPQAAQSTEIPRPKRAEGQWALGYSEPLNKNEQSKKDDDPLNVRDRILHIYSKRGFASIDPADLRGRFRWWGLYTQRKPGFDGGKTGALEPHELDDRYFMMRVRTDGALLGPAQLRALGSSSTDFARDTADITDRQNIQYHWISVEDVPAIWQRLEAVGHVGVDHPDLAAGDGFEREAQVRCSFAGSADVIRSRQHGQEREHQQCDACLNLFRHLPGPRRSNYCVHRPNDSFPRIMPPDHATRSTQRR